MEAIIRHTRGLPLVFPVHPRTAMVLEKLGIDGATLLITEPLGYLEFNYLVKHAKAVLTDSGGITEETTVMGIPCMTLRDNTERPETVTVGTNQRFSEKYRKGDKKVGTMNEQNSVSADSMSVLFEELEQECMTAIRYIEALKLRELSGDQKEDILGELSASITHLKIQTKELDKRLENL